MPRQISPLRTLLPPLERALNPLAEPTGLLVRSNSLEESPYQLLRRMEAEMERMWSQFTPSPISELSTSVPRMDIVEEPEQWRIDVDLPGVDKKNIDVSVQGHQLVIKAERKQESEEKRDKNQYYRRERYYGTYERHLMLPESVKENAISSAFKDGVLSVFVPKSEPEQNPSRQIPVE